MKKNERRAVAEALSVLYANNEYFKRESKKLFGRKFPRDMVAGNKKAYESLAPLSGGD